MKISIITATYNNQHTIVSTIESVLHQTYQDIEYIIIDGASTDNTLNIAEKYEPLFNGRMKIVSEPDKGIYDALNKGISYATGDVIGFIHADDTIASNNIIEQVVANFSEHNCDLLYGDLYYVDANDQKIVRNWKSQPYNNKLLRKGWMPAHPTLYVRREIYYKIGGFDTTFRIAADYDFILRAFTFTPEEKIVYLPFVMVRMKVGGVSNNGLANILQKMKEDLHAIKNNKIGGMGTLIIKNTSKIKQLFTFK